VREVPLRSMPPFLRGESLFFSAADPGTAR